MNVRYLIIRRFLNWSKPCKHITVDIPVTKGDTATKKVISALRNAGMNNSGGFIIVEFVRDAVFISSTGNGIKKELREYDTLSCYISSVEFRIIHKEFEKWLKLPERVRGR